MRAFPHYVCWLLGIASAETQTTVAERDSLARHAAGRRRLVEIGVWHGVTTKHLRRVMADLHRLAEGKPVTFHHDIDDVALVRMYRSALCVVLPSVYDDMYGRHTDVPELLGQRLLEGMACGTPAIGTRVASIPEVVEDGVTGYLVPPNDPDALGRALASLATNPDRVHQMGQAARQRVAERFSWPGVVSACLEAYAA